MRRSPPLWCVIRWAERFVVCVLRADGEFMEVFANFDTCAEAQAFIEECERVAQERSWLPALSVAREAMGRRSA